MAWTKVQSATGGSASVGSSVTVTLTGVTAGNLIVVIRSAWNNNGAAGAAPTDSNGTVGTAVNEGVTTAFGGYSQTSVYYVASANAGTHTFTFTTASGSPVHVTAAEYNYGTGYTYAADQAALNTNAASPVASGTTAALATTFDLAVAAVAIPGSTGATNAAITDPPSGFTSLFAQQNTASDLGTEHCYAALSSSSAVSTSWSYTSDTINNTAAIATFKATSSGGATGNGSPTEGADTASATGGIQIPGTASPTEAHDTSSATGNIAIPGSAAVTESADTASGAGTAGAVGSAAVTEAADTAAATGAQSVSGSASVSEGADVASATGALSVSGTAAIAESADTASASGTATNSTPATVGTPPYTVALASRSLTARAVSRQIASVMSARNLTVKAA
ncbi:MAG: hypothetical protein KGL39_31085 [Patescibacteria group bacterium]|nr:hypothetical protein [Patescibacteria group bacterium]